MRRLDLWKVGWTLDGRVNTMADISGFFAVDGEDFETIRQLAAEASSVGAEPQPVDPSLITLVETSYVGEVYVEK